MLVAVTIFTTVLAGVTLLFNSAVRVSKQGYQNQEAYSMARGVARRIEADLTGAYAALEHGLGDTFYGSPIGFTFIGKIKTGEGANDYDLARVSYVIYLGPNTPGEQKMTKEYEDTSLSDDALSEELFGLDPLTGLQKGSIRGDGRRQTFSLIRFVEPNVEDLDTFDVNWDASAFAGESYSFNDLIGNAKDVLRPGYVAGNYSGTYIGRAILSGNCSPGDFNCAEAVEKSAKREFWLRILAGDPSVNIDYMRDVQRVVPDDYVIAEDLLHIARQGFYEANDTSSVVYKVSTFEGSNQNAKNSGAFEVIDDSNFSGLPFISANHIAPIINANHVIPIIDINDLYQGYQGQSEYPKYPSNNYFFAYRTMGVGDRIIRDEIDNDYGGRVVAKGLLGGSINSWQNDDPDDDESPPALDFTLYEQEVRGIDFAYWNDFRNLISNRVTGDFDGTPTEGRLPESIICELTVYLPSVYPGAPDFQRTFVQRIDTPVGYKRSFPTSRQDAVRNLDQQTAELYEENRN
jgi:hypothetical protein